jgi:hypothetical protein
MSLKRNKPMPPRKEWMNRSSLRSSTPPAEGKPATRKTGKHVGVNEARDKVEERSGGLCEIREPGCFNVATDWHHRKLRSQGGKWHVQNGLHLCRFCHDLVTNPRGRRKEFEDNGWLVPSHEDPAKKDCLIYTWWFGHDYVLLLDEYPWVELAPFPAGDPRHPDDIEHPREPRGLDGVA